MKIKNTSCKHDAHPQLTPIAQVVLQATLLSVALAAGTARAEDEDAGAQSTQAAASAEHGEKDEEQAATDSAGKQDGSAAMLPTLTVTADSEPDGSAASGYRVKSSSIAGFSEQDILDTPFSVKVLPSELMRNHNVKSISDLDKLDASVTSSIANPGWYSSPSIRGFVLDNTVNFRYNGQMMVNLQSTGLENKERVEVLKGLSALQTGFAGPGGLINYVTKRPTAGPLTEINYYVNEFDNTRSHVDISRRTADGRFGLRLNAVTEEERSYVRSVDGERRFFALAADALLTPDTILEFDVEYERREQNGQPFLSPDVNGKLPSGFDPRTFLGQRWARYPTEYTMVSGKLKHQFNDDWSFTLDGNWSKLRREQNMIWSLSDIQDNGDSTMFLYYSPDQEANPINARLTVNGRFDTGPLNHELAFGGMMHRLKQRWGNGFWGEIGKTNIYNPVSIADPSPDAPDARLARRVEEDGIFLYDVISLGESWKLHLGGRYSMRNERTYNTGTGDRKDQYKEYVYTPSYALVYKPQSNVSLYVSYIEGLEQGRTAPAWTKNRNEQLSPLLSEQWEAGVKVELARGLNFDAALFRIEKPGQYINSDDVLVKDGEQRHQGLELSLTGKASPEWTIFASAMFLDARLMDGSEETDENRPSDVPARRFSAIAEYSPLWLNGWTFTGSWTYNGARHVNEENTGESAESYDVFGFGTRYETQIGAAHTTLRLNLDNVFDKNYWSQAESSNLVAGAPRTASASVSVRF
ncbi:TonB-dependent siderophore receptor [Azotobacter salinestris]|uniref:TonB-dependent siderophore receptor n=1 Tax=Azotobacter salinestris TaxID=69964 RepID=UPI0012669BCB|nr:TonB-dependent siderophore receptor [Azotobacter salinestris]